MFHEKFEYKIHLLLRQMMLLTSLALIYLNGTYSSRSGQIVPKSISVIEGSNITLECSFNSSLCSSICFDKLKCDGLESSGIIVDNICVHFEYYNRTTISKEYITVINSSVVALNLINTQPMNEIIKCHCNDCSMDGSDVYVAKHLEPITDFGCQSYDFNYMDCGFSSSDYFECDFFSLNYSISALKSGTFDSSNSKICNLKYDRNINKCSCKIEGSNYYQFYPYYLFKLNANFNGQQQIQEFTIKQIEIMKPAKPEFKLIKKTSNSLKLEWEYKNGKHFATFNKLITFNVKYYPRLELKEVEVNTLSNGTFEEIDNSKYTIELKDLDYAYTNYTIEIISQIKSAEIITPTLKSKQILVLETEATDPKIGPKVLPGSFYIDDNQNKIRLYWQPLQKFKENGKNVTYIIKEVFINDQQKLNWRPEELKINSALYSGYEIKNKYDFHIYSKNEVGVSRKYSSITVPKRVGIEKDVAPLFVGKISNKETTNLNNFEIIWTEPVNNIDLDNYTIFWCKATDEMSPEICESTKNNLNFTVVNSSKKSYSFTIGNIHDIYNLGVSANYKSFSSGIVWAPCTANKNADLKEVDILRQSIFSGRNYVTINWNLQCKYETLAQNYDLKYCHGIKSNDEDCESGTIKIIKINKNMDSSTRISKIYTLHNLQPNQKYLINIRMSSGIKVGPYLKAPLVSYTQEDAPTSPRNLKLLNVTNNSAKIEWTAPEKLNGIIRSYEILLYDSIRNNSIKNITLEVNKTNKTNNPIQCTIAELKSYNSYRVFIIAKTKYSSNLSNGLEFKTSEGHPSGMQRGNLKKDNEKTIISWNSPIDKGSDNITFYQVIVKTEQQSQISILSQQLCTLRYTCDDFKKNSQFILNAISINAVPKERYIGNNGTFFVIPQCEKSFSQDDSDGKFLCEENINTGFFTKEYCNSNIFLASNESIIYDYYDCGEGSFSIIVLIIIVITIILICLGLFAGCYFASKKYKAMKDINITYPYGLYDAHSIISERQNGNCKKKSLTSFAREKLNLFQNNFLNLKRNIKLFDENRPNSNEFENTINRNIKPNIHLDKEAEKLLNEQNQEVYLPMTPINSTDHCKINSSTEIKTLPISNNKIEEQKNISNENLNENETEFNQQCQFLIITKDNQNKSIYMLPSGYVRPVNRNFLQNNQNEIIEMLPSGYVRPVNRNWLPNNENKSIDMLPSGYVRPVNRNWLPNNQNTSTDMLQSGYVRTINRNLLPNNQNKLIDMLPSGYVRPVNRNWLPNNQNTSTDMFQSGYVRTINRNLLPNNQNKLIDMLPSGYVRPGNRNLLQNTSGYVHPNWKNFMQRMTPYNSVDQNPSEYVHTMQFYNPILNNTNITEAELSNLKLSDEFTSGYVHPIPRNFLRNPNLSFDQNSSSFAKDFQQSPNLSLDQMESGYVHHKWNNILKTNNFNKSCDIPSLGYVQSSRAFQEAHREISPFYQLTSGGKNNSGNVLPGNLNIYYTESYISEPNINQQNNQIIDSKQGKTDFFSAYVKPIQLEKCKSFINQSELKNEKILKQCDEYNLQVVPESGGLMKQNIDDSILGEVLVNCIEFEKKMEPAPEVESGYVKPNI